MDKWWRLFLCRHPDVSARLAQHAETVLLDKKLTNDDWLKEFASLNAPTSNPHKTVVLIVDGSKKHLSRAIIEEASKLAVHLVALPSHLTDVVGPLDLSVWKHFKAALKQRQRDLCSRTEARA